MSPWNSYTEVGHTIHGLLLGEAHLRMSYIPMVVKYPLTYRNFRDAVTLEDLDLEIHFAKEAQILSKDAKSNTRLIDGINLVLARNYSENLKEEVKKGMREEASQGIYPGHAPFGYRNNKAEELSKLIRSIHRWSPGSWNFMRPAHTHCPRSASF